jgi:glutamate-1-semialdehyde 2,1-aminomutase
MDGATASSSLRSAIRPTIGEVTIVDDYLARTPASAAIGTRAEAVMPAGDTRAAGYHAPYPLTISHGAGAKVWDIDGNEYWDVIGNYTSLIHGHAYPPIVEAATKAIQGGTAWPARNTGQIGLAELICERVPSVEHLRFCNSGSEANMLALAVCRAATGRTKALMARHGYHGSHEVFESGMYASPEHAWEHTLLADYGDAESFEAVLAEHGHEIAGVFLEPVMGSAGIISAPPEFYERVKQAAHKAGAIFVLDEVITLRLARGGHQQNLGVMPDLTTMGKIIGGGFPVGAIGGSKALMEMLDPRTGKIFHSGTFNGNPVTTAAGYVSVMELTEDRISTMSRQTEWLEAQLHQAAAALGLPFSSRRAGSMINLYFLADLPGVNMHRPDAKTAAAFHLAGMNQGCYFPQRGMLALSTVMTDADVADIADRLSAALADTANQFS